MKKKPNLDDLDVVFDPTPLTADEKRLLSEYIRRDKAKWRKKQFAHHHSGSSRTAALASRRQLGNRRQTLSRHTNKHCGQQLICSSQAEIFIGP